MDSKQKSLFPKPEGKIPAIPTLITAYLESLGTEKNASHYTLVNYEIDLRHWLKNYAESHPGKLEIIEVTSLKALRDFLSGDVGKYSRATMARRLSAIKGFFKYLHREGYIDRNIAKLIQLPRAEVTLPNILRADEVIRMLEAVPTATLRQKRIRCMLEVLYSTGIRISEMVGLDHGDIDFKGGTLRVLGKGRKERVVPMGRHCQTALRDYIDSVPGFQKKGAKTPLLMSPTAERISVRTAQRDLRSVAVETLGTKGVAVSPHTLRHSCATHLLAAGAGLREIQELLGHQSLVTTQKYTQVDIERLKASYKKAHPKGREAFTDSVEGGAEVEAKEIK